MPIKTGVFEAYGFNQESSVNTPLLCILSLSVESHVSSICWHANWRALLQSVFYWLLILKHWSKKNERQDIRATKTTYSVKALSHYSTLNSLYQSSPAGSSTYARVTAYWPGTPPPTEVAGTGAKRLPTAMKPLVAALKVAIAFWRALMLAAPTYWLLAMTAFA